MSILFKGKRLICTGAWLNPSNRHINNNTRWCLGNQTIKWNASFMVGCSKSVSSKYLFPQKTVGKIPINFCQSLVSPSLSLFKSSWIYFFGDPVIESMFFKMHFHLWWMVHLPDAVFLEAIMASQGTCRRVSHHLPFREITLLGCWRLEGKMKIQFFRQDKLKDRHLGIWRMYLKLQTTIFSWMFGETAIFHVKTWNHPTETTIYTWLFRVPGIHCFFSIQFF